MKETKGEVKKGVSQAAGAIKRMTSEEYTQLAKKMMHSNVMVKEIAGISDEKEEGIYAQAYVLYNTGRYKEASEVFRVLIMLNSTEPKYIMGLAACFHMMKQYASATSMYTMCSLLDPNSPLPYFHASDCYIQMGDLMSAALCLKMAIDKAQEKPEYSTLKERSQITLDGLKKEA
jgi:type III secretion system low calcium response chaperone LcrH/SycD